MEDVQSYPDERRIAIDRVGVRGLRYPITVLDPSNRTQETTATITMSVSLPHHFKGAHMSRFIEVLNEHRGEVTLRTLPAILADLRQRLEAERAHVKVAFPYFIERTAPVSRANSLMDYESWFVAESTEEESDFVLGVDVPITTLCPCSKTISEYGAHNQRGHVRMQVRSRIRDTGEREIVWIEELVEWAEACASAPLYPLLKRSDERHVTMQAYDNPAFVEDVVRDISARLRSDRRIEWHSVEVETLESIHNHNAYASIEWDRSRGVEDETPQNVDSTKDVVARERVGARA